MIMVARQILFCFRCPRPGHNRLTGSGGQPLTRGQSDTRVLVNLFYGFYGLKPSVPLWCSTLQSLNVVWVVWCGAKYMLFLCFVLILGLYLVMEVVSQWRALQPLPRRIESDDLKALQRLIKRERCRHRDEMIEQQYAMSRLRAALQRAGVNQSLTCSGL